MADTRKRRNNQNRRKQPIATPYPWNEGIAIAMGGLGLLLFLALISYTPLDLPSWVPISMTAGGHHQATNFVGPVGAVIAGYLYFLFGAACYLIPGVIVWWGIQVLLGHRVFRNRNFVAFVALIFSAACLVDFQTLFFQDWTAQYNLPKSSGGFIGFGIGNKIVKAMLGVVGAFVVMFLVYFMSLIVITGIHPYRFLMLCRERLGEYLKNRKEAREAEAYYDFADEPSVPEPRPRRANSRRKKKAAAEEAAAESEGNGGPREMELALEDPPPKPKIIDASMPKKSAKGEDDEDGSGALFGKKKKGKGGGLVVSSGQFKDYELPSLKLLQQPDEEVKPVDKNELLDLQQTIVDTLDTFGIQVTPGDITRGPTITRYEIYPGKGLRVNRITSLEADIARATKAERINIIAPIPGKDTVGIEIANTKKILVPLRELFEGTEFRKSRAKIPLALGKDVYGNIIIGDLAQMPHLLVAGATGSGKSVCINSIVASLLYRFTPDELRFIMIDPKVVEMQLYNELPHMVVPVVTDAKKVLLALRWVINEMERRYAMFAKLGCRNFDSFNSRKTSKRAVAKAEEEAAANAKEPELAGAGAEALTAHAVNISEDAHIPADEAAKAAKAANSKKSLEDGIPDTLPYIVVIIDELADLMQTAPADVETAIARIAQKARAAGIHLIVATQTPRADVVTGIIKANIPSRIAFQVASKIDSRVILDVGGAERLVGKGDMLYLPPGSAQLIRSQGALITDDEIQDLVEYCGQQGDADFALEVQEVIENGFEDEEGDVTPEDEEVLERCMEVIYQEKKASTSLLQRRLRLGYTRAARMIDILEQRGIIGPGDGAKPREILVDLSPEYD